jgi:hypothetical protein
MRLGCGVGREQPLFLVACKTLPYLTFFVSRPELAIGLQDSTFLYCIFKTRTTANFAPEGGGGKGLKRKGADHGMFDDQQLLLELGVLRLQIPVLAHQDVDLLLQGVVLMFQAIAGVAEGPQLLRPALPHPPGCLPVGHLSATKSAV